MKKLDILLEEYGVSHKNPVNKLIHWICVPLIILSIIFLLGAIPAPEIMSNKGLNWSFIVMGAALFYYMFLSTSLAIGMLIVFFMMSIIFEIVLESTSYPIWGIGLTIFVLAWIGQFYGHKIEGKKPSFLKDVQFLLIGPLWLLNSLYKQLGIPS